MTTNQSTEQSDQTAQPTHVVLVPGFWLGASAWDDVVPHLGDDDQRVRVAEEQGERRVERVALGDVRRRKGDDERPHRPRVVEHRTPDDHPTVPR